MVSRTLLEVAAREQSRIVPATLLSPTRGWNVKDALDAMEPGFATELTNFFPFNGYCTLRGGSTVYASGLGGSVETLATWRDSGAAKVIAGANGQLWDVQFGSATSLAAGFTSNRWQTDQNKGTRPQPSGATPTNLYLVNGSDTPQFCNGTAVAPCTWTAGPSQPALNIADLQYIHISKDVLFLAEKGQLGFWHGAKGATDPATALAWFDLGSVLPNGGEIVAIGTMTLEGGEGPDDYTVFVSSSGFVAMYRGGDPSQATDWEIVGRYPVGFPLGLRCLLEIAGDVVVLTVNGYISMRQFVQIGGLERRSFVFNDNIQPQVVLDAGDYANEFGWQPVLVPGLTLALFNVPQGSGKFVQHVVNTQTQAWALLEGWDALCWAFTQTELLYGDASGNVILANVGGTDVGARAIEGTGLTYFSTFGSPGVQKHFQLARTILETVGSVSAAVAIAVDYDKNLQVSNNAVPVDDDAAEWDVSEWDTAIWGGAPITRQDWYDVGKLGYAAALRLTVVSTGTRCRWKHTDLALIQGSIL